MNPKLVDPYSLLAFLWSQHGWLQFEQRVRGSTGQTEIYPQDIEQIKVVMPSEEDQQIAGAKIREHFALLDQAERLRREAVQEAENLLGDEA